MITLKKAIREAKKNKVAIAHFNISEFVTLKACWEAALELSQSVGRKIPIIFGTTEHEREFLGNDKEIVAMVKHLRKHYNYPVFLNADHTHKIENAKSAIDAGYDAVIIDEADKPFADNVAMVREIVQYARASKNKKVLIEGEIGFIGAGSQVHDKLPDGVEITEDTITKPEQAAQFVELTGVDMLAPAVGNVHGMFKDSGTFTKHLFIKRIKEIRRAAKVPLVLHGGSGTPDEEFLKAIDVGVSIIHISTELRRALRTGIEKGLHDLPSEVAPYNLLKPAFVDVKAVALARLKLFNKIN